MDTAGIAELHEAHGGAIERLAGRRLGSAADAADIAQSVWCRLLESQPAAPPRDARRFLVTVALNLIRDRARRAVRRERGHKALAELAPTAAPSPEDLALEQQRHAALMAAIASLPTRTRTVLLLFRVKQLSYLEIATRLEMSPRTVEHHLREALIRLRRHLVSIEGDRTGA